MALLGGAVIRVQLDRPPVGHPRSREIAEGRLGIP